MFPPDQQTHHHNVIATSAPTTAATTPKCANCSTQTTPLWRRDECGATLCNACALFQKMKGRPRPISLKTDVIKQRNRVKAVDRDKPQTRKKSAHIPSDHSPTLDLDLDSDRDVKPFSSPSVPPTLRSSTLHCPSHRQATRSRDPVRSSANPRKSDPGGVLDPVHPPSHGPSEVHHHSNRPKRRKDLCQPPPACSSNHQVPPPLLGRPKSGLTSILRLDDGPAGPLRTQSLAGFRSSSQPHHHPCSSASTGLAVSVGSPKELSFDLRPVSLERLSHSDTPEAPSSSIPHSSIPARRIPPSDLLSFSPIPSPLARSVSVDRRPASRSPLELNPVQPTPLPILPRDDERGRPRFRLPLRLPPLSQLTARVSFSPHDPLPRPLSNDTRFCSATSTPYEHSPSRTTCGPPLSFEASALEARIHSPQASRTPTLPRILPLAPGLDHHHGTGRSTRACSVVSSASDNDSAHSPHLPPTPWPEPEPGKLLSLHHLEQRPHQPLTPPESESRRRGFSETRKESESDGELGRLRNRVQELELLNGLMKTRIGQLEQAGGEDHQQPFQQHSRTCSTASLTRWVTTPAEEYSSIGSSSSSGGTGGVGVHLSLGGDAPELDQLDVMHE